MGALGGLLGTAGGAGGTGFAGPRSAPVQNPTTPENVQASTAGVTGALGGSDALLQSILAQLPPDARAKLLNRGTDISDQLSAQGAPDMQGNAGLGTAGVVQDLKGLNGTGTMGAATANQGALATGVAGLGGPQTLGAATGAQGNLLNDVTGIGGASAVGNALGAQGNLIGALNNANGIGMQTGAAGNLTDVYGRQQMTDDQLRGIANGTGPNPAQAMLNQATGQNVANQAALMAGQRGAGANVGLIARQAGQQGAGIQQNAAGQGATMQAQQQLNAINGLSGVEQGMTGTNTALGQIGSGLTGATQTGISNLGNTGVNTLGAQQTATTGLGNMGTAAINAGNTTNTNQFTMGKDATAQQLTGLGQLNTVGSNIVNENTNQVGVNAGIVRDQMGNVVSVNGENVTGNLGNQGQQFGAVQGTNQSATTMQGNVNSGNAQLGAARLGQQSGAIGGGLNALGQASGLVGGNGAVKPVGGGKGPSGTEGVGGEAGTGGVSDGSTGPEGNMVQQNAPVDPNRGNGAQVVDQSNSPASPDSSVNNGGYNPQPPPPQMDQPLEPRGQMAQGGEVKAQSSFGQFLTNRMANGGAVNDYRGGALVQALSKGQKAVKSGNSYANDKVPAMLSEGEVVIPRSVMQSKDPARSAADFVSKVLAKRGKK